MAEGSAQPFRTESLDTIPEALHSHFAKVPGEDGKELFEYRPPREDTSGLKSTLGKKERALKQLEEELKAVRERYSINGQEIDPDEVAKLLEAQRQQQGKEMLSRADAEKEWQERADKVKQGLRKDIDTRDGRIKELEDTLYGVLVDDGIRAAAQHPDLPFRLQDGAADWLIKAAKFDGAIKIVDGKPVPMDGDRPATNAKGELMTLADWIAAKVAQYSWLAVASQGMGTQPAASGGGPLPNGKIKRADMTVAQKVEYVGKYGAEKFNQLPK